MSFQKVQQNEKQFNLCQNHSGTRVNILHLKEQEFIKMSFQGRECCFLFKKMFGFVIVAAVVLCCSCCALVVVVVVVYGGAFYHFSDVRLMILKMPAKSL